ncbi:polymeric immunoglobulin receptor-like isoform X2 [Carassius carassius]|uniref:polymeric immunoglobulin receptor-like isoform X2 n=1 Tax=Carassius carassius TaxID=217509 RepID=UPI0028684A84|nr:polymeric immunoglobulin receptor-like isoform X2 [Carassius carassius]
MAVHTKTKIFYISVGFWLILGVESYDAWTNQILTVQTGGSVTIPCYYDKKYTQQKKSWFSDIDQTYTYTNTNTTEQNLSVIDHPDQSFFIVTMRNLQNEVSGGYRCIVGTEGIMATTYEVYIKVQSAPDVSVVSSSVSGHEGGDISVKCLYSSGYQNKVKRWCRYKDQRCYTVGRTDTSQNSSVQIRDDDGRRSFTVLMTGLRRTDSSWYFCSAGGVINPVHITVTKAEPDKEKDTDNELLTVLLLVSAALLLLLILISVFIWRLRRRPKQDEHQIRERKISSTTDTDPVNDIIYYSTIDDIPGSEATKCPSGGAIYSSRIYSTVGPH